MPNPKVEESHAKSAKALVAILEVHVVDAAGVSDISFEAQLSGAFADSRALLWLEVLPLGSTKGLVE